MARALRNTSSVQFRIYDKTVNLRNFENWSCSSCNALSIVRPMYTDGKRLYCDQCPPVGLRSYTYEEMFGIRQSSIFSYIHGSCSTQSAGENLEQHEQECLDSFVRCPVKECQMKSNIRMFESHFYAHHAELIYMDVINMSDSVLRNSGGKVFLLISEGIPVIVLVSDVIMKLITMKLFNMGADYKVSIGVFGVKNVRCNVRYDAEFRLDYGDNSTTTNVKNQQIKFYYRSTRNTADCLTTMENSYPCGVQCPNVATKLRMSLTLKLYSTAEDSKEQQKEDSDISDVNSSVFTCPTCCQFMGSRIFQCISGRHSFCEKCKNNTSSCSRCKEGFGPRNYLLEDIRTRVFKNKNSDK